MSLEEPLPAEPTAPAEGAPPDEASAEHEGLSPVEWRRNLLLFALTLLSVFHAGALYGDKLPKEGGWLATLKALPEGWPFAVSLLAILLVHEFGHYIAARLHGVDASLPFFIPFPFLSPMGTMGAVIAMRGRIRSRKALLDIGASGPLAGLAVAIPVLVLGLSLSEVKPLSEHGALEGQSLLYLLLKRVVLGPIPDGHDVYLGPVAFAGWGGLLVTSLNLIPIAQLDGGHIAYALFGLRQNRIARVLHWSLLGMFALNLIRFAWPIVKARAWSDLGGAVGNSMSWLVWFLLLGGLMRVGGRDHPPVEEGELDPIRKGIAVFSLVLFVLLFMPTPWTNY